MNKKQLYLLLALCCLALTYGFQRWESFPVFGNSDNVEIPTALECESPAEYGIKNIKQNEAIIYWEDNVNSSWEYYVVPVGDPRPTATFTTSKENIITQDNNGNLLLPDTEYEFRVRAICGEGGTSSWTDPFDFKTLCMPFSIPFVEGFNTGSTTIDCWTIVDVNNDKDRYGGADLNIWKENDHIFATPAFEGNGSMVFHDFLSNTLIKPKGITHDDWLISPAITMDGGIYAISYYYKTTTIPTYKNEFEVLLSQNGIDLDQFTTVLLPKQSYAEGDFRKKTIYVSGITGDVHIGWHVTSINQTEIILDWVTVEEVGCLGFDLDDIEMSNLMIDEVTFEWTDENNAQWEYYVQPSLAGGGTPTGSGTIINATKETITRVSSGAALQPDGIYEFWIRSICGSGKNSDWIGPVVFRTPCVLPLPFWEEFNASSPTFSCWTIVDDNKDEFRDGSGVLNGIWRQRQEDVTFLCFAPNPKAPHDDWLISPTFVLDDTKFYRLSYNYYTQRPYKAEYRVMLSNKGADIESFDTILDVHKRASNHIGEEEIAIGKGLQEIWEEEALIIGGIGGNVNIAWHVDYFKEGVMLRINNVLLEEIEEKCPEPFKLETKEEGETQATVFWTDDFGSDWEYVVQKPPKFGSNLPKGAGVKTKNKEVVVDKDIDGKSLEPNTEYEFYVRSKCEDGYSRWAGPFVFRTTCGVFSIPFWEGFNIGENSVYCWSVLDGNKDISTFRVNLWNVTNGGNEKARYEGTGTATFGGASGGVYGEMLVPYDDWLISPTIRLESDKSYRLKYHYQVGQLDSLGANNGEMTHRKYEFEVLLSNSGRDMEDFTQTVVPRKIYAANPENEWEEEYAFITGAGGDVNLAWHIPVSTGYTSLSIDNVFVEEVENCFEPLNLMVKEIEDSQVTLGWDDDMGGVQYEYFVQEAAKGVPVGNGKTVSTQEVAINEDIEGNTLEAEKDYEFYVRTDCGDGTYSVWRGPVEFTIPADLEEAEQPECNATYKPPFWEGFNSDSQTIHCWENEDREAYMLLGLTTADVIATTFGYSAAEGDESDLVTNVVDYLVVGAGAEESSLISPTFTLDGGVYALRYEYICPDNLAAILPVETQMELIVSGKDKSGNSFQNTLKTEQAYVNNSWKSEVQVISGIDGEVNIEWRVSSSDTTLGLYSFGIDNVSLEKVEGGCLEPFNVKVIGQTTNSIDIEWEQYDNSLEWEVIVVDYGKDETAVPIQAITVTGTPNAKISGLEEGKGYSIYVRAKCEDDKTYSGWSEVAEGATQVGANDNCHGAKNIPVSTERDCEYTVAGTWIGATANSAFAEPSCGSSLDEKIDVWFEFTAINTSHTIQMVDWVDIIRDNYTTTFYGALYTQPCDSITAVALECFAFNSSSGFHILRELLPGQKYYIRLGVATLEKMPDIFEICISSPSYLDVSPSGEKYTAEELVREVLFDSECDLVSSVHYQVGDGSPETESINAIGYFNKNNSVFPFEKGVVISTGEVKYIPGPYYSSRLTKGSNPLSRWVGDKDINDFLSTVGSSADEKRVTQLEFDFIPLKDSIQLDYLFASDSYRPNYDGCKLMAAFMALLIDTTTGEGENLATIESTGEPIADYLIWDATKVKIRDSNTNAVTAERCEKNPEFFWNAYDEGGNADPLEAPFNLAGSTVAMSSGKVPVVPGRTYRFKFAVMSFSVYTMGDFAAVFLDAESFKGGNITLGEDRLIETNNALCYDQKAVISSQTDVSDQIEKEYEWYKDGQLIVGATSPDLEISGAGEYKVVMKLIELDCEITDTIVVEVYPAISETVHQAKPIEVCSTSLQDIRVNLTQVEAEMFHNVDTTMYSIEGYYETAEEAEVAENAIANAESYPLGKEVQPQNLYIRVENTVTGCYEVFELNIKPQKGESPKKPENVAVCSEYVFPALENNQYYYSESGGGGVEYRAEEVLSVPGEHTIYVLQLNNEEGCYEETSYKVNITEAVVADMFEAVEIECELYVLEPLSGHGRYFTEPNGEGRELFPGMEIPVAQTIYVYAESEDGLCTDESSFTITYNDCPIPRGISPNGDGLNDRFDLSRHGVESIKIYNRWGTEVYSHGTGYVDQWEGQSKSGQQLPDGTYYYVIIAHGKVRTGWVQINR